MTGHRQKSKRAKYAVSCLREQVDYYGWRDLGEKSPWHWSVALIYEDETMYSASDATLHIALRKVLDYAFVERRARVIRDFGGSQSSRIACLRSSASRRIQAVAMRKRMVQDRRQRALKRARHRRAAALVTRLSCAPSRRNIQQFHRLWRSVTGYGARDEALRNILAPGKETIIRMSLSAAREKGWRHGRAHDPDVHNGYSDVIYIDTPQGQISFHVRPGVYGELPAYDASWSGRADSHQILSRLAAAGLITDSSHAHA